ncbi:MAG: glycine zipper 2TM domain-containing protein [Trinickia sp.]
MNHPTPSPRRLHPLIAGAAGAIIIASLAATAAVTGVFPRASSTTQTSQSASASQSGEPIVDSAAPATAVAVTGQQPAEQSSTTAQPTQAQAPAHPPGQIQYSGQAGQPSYAQQPYGPQPQARNQPYQLAQQPYAQPQPPSRPSAACASCGTVESIVPVRHQGRGTGIGAVGGAVVGGLLGNQFGRGSGRLGMTALGAVGGGFAGNAVEKHLRSETDYQVRVRMENGRLRYFTYRQAPPFQQGERVHLSHGTLAAG